MASGTFNLFISQPAGLLLTIVTAAVGGIALYIYFRQHKDDKVIAAQSIFSELGTAENALKGIRERFFATTIPILENNVIMRYESWSKNKHLFLKDLTTEEWNVVDRFYTSCSNYDSAVTTNKTNIRLLVEENYRHQYARYAKVVEEYHMMHPTDDELPDEVVNRLLAYQRMFLNTNSKSKFDYVPQQGVAEARTALLALDTSVTTSSAGQKLKKLAKL